MVIGELAVKARDNRVTVGLAEAARLAPVTGYRYGSQPKRSVGKNNACVPSSIWF
jgi:hypothetical protein